MQKVGIDIVEISRFSSVIKKKQIAFLEKVFSLNERNYCFSYHDPTIHFAGIFAAKEAAAKALGATRYPFFEIEIRHTGEGAPIVYYKNKKLKVSVSIAHTKEIATAIAIA